MCLLGGEPDVMARRAVVEELQRLLQHSSVINFTTHTGTHNVDNSVLVLSVKRGWSSDETSEEK